MKKVTSILCVLFMLATMLAGCNTPEDTSPSQSVNISVPSSSINTPEPEPNPAHAASYIDLWNNNGKLAIIVDESFVTTDYSYMNSDLRISMDGSKAACLTQEGILLYIYDGQVKKIAENVASYQLSVNGESIAYQLKAEHSFMVNMAKDLFFYQMSKDSAEMIIETGEQYIPDYILSPDGQTLAYLLATSPFSNIDCQLILHQNGVGNMRTQMKENVGYQLISVNNNTDMIYMLSKGIVVNSIDKDGNITPVGKASASSPDSVTALNGHLYVSNADHTQLLFADDYGTYLSDHGKQAVKIGTANMLPVEPARSPFQYGDHTITCHFETLNGHLMQNVEEIGFYPRGFWYPNESGEYDLLAEFEITSDLDKYMMDQTGRYLFYSRGNQALQRIDLKTGEHTTPYQHNLPYYAISPDCSAIYYSTGSSLYRTLQQDFAQTEHIMDQYIILSIFILENQKPIFSVIQSEQDSRKVYTLSDTGEMVLFVENPNYFHQNKFGMLHIRASDVHYIVKDSVLIPMQTITLA